MKFAVLGAGAVGAYLGAALTRGGSDVVLIARGPHLRAMQRNGVTVTSSRGDFHAHVPATDDLDALQDADVVIVGLKAYSLPGIVDSIASRLRSDASVLSAQNGIPWWYFHRHGGACDGLVLESVDPGAVIAAALGPERAVGCVVYCSTQIVSPGVIRHVEGTRFAIGEPDGSRSARCSEISRAFTAGGLKCPIEEELRPQIWLKLIGNVAFNPVSVLTRATMSELGDHSETRRLIENIMLEAVSVSRALGISLPVSVDRRLEAGFEVGDHKTSMLQDFEAGKRLEFECMTGALLELADRFDLEVPSTRAVHACIKLLDAAVQRNGDESVRSTDTGRGSLDG